MKLVGKFKNLYWRCNRNKQSFNAGHRAEKNKVNIEWWNKEVNVGDTLSPLICHFLLAQKGIDPDKPQRKTKHLYAVGSVVGGKQFDATVWGSGVLDIETIRRIVRNEKIVKLDIRALRGPLSQQVLCESGYDADNCVWGDPGVLMPLIFKPENVEKKYKYTLIHHHDSEMPVESDDHILSVHTDNYEQFITEILESEVVISSSLHGIILAESYGVPAVFLLEGALVKDQFFKYFDYYFSTGRYNVKIAGSVEEAKTMTPMELPDLREMQENLLNSFPYDLWTEG